MDRAQLMTRHFPYVQVCGFLGLLCVASLVGCSDGNPATAKVSGTITANGKAVPGGEILLSPIGDGKSMPGKTAVATVDFDGTFTLTTYKDGDGAVVGKNAVRFNPPVDEPPSAPAGGHVATRPSPYAGLVPKEKEFDVKAGEENELTIELVPATPAAK